MTFTIVVLNLTPIGGSAADLPVSGQKKQNNLKLNIQSYYPTAGNNKKTLAKHNVRRSGSAYLTVVTSMLHGLWLMSALRAAGTAVTVMDRQAPTDTGPPTARSRITVKSRDHLVGNRLSSFITWGDRISLNSYSQQTWPFVIVNLYYRLGADGDRRHLNIYCWKAISHSSVPRCL